MRKHLIRSIILTLCVLFACCACQSPKNTKDTQPTKKVDLEIVYKRNQLCYSVIAQGDDTSFYVFNAAAQPIFDTEGNAITAMNLTPGMLVSVEYDGYILETYPAQFSGVSEIRVTGMYANSVEFACSLLSGMFPSAMPDDIERWEIFFEGENFLSAKEKKALEYIMGEEWGGADIVVDPEQSHTKKTGHITITTSKAGDDSITLKTLVDSGVEGSTPAERTMTVSIQDGKWSITGRA